MRKALWIAFWMGFFVPVLWVMLTFTLLGHNTSKVVDVVAVFSCPPLARGGLLRQATEEAAEQ